MQMNEHQCPQNKSEWDTASQRLQCVDPNSYHCLRTEDGGETEQCLGKVWIQEGDSCSVKHNIHDDLLNGLSCINLEGNDGNGEKGSGCLAFRHCII